MDVSPFTREYQSQRQALRALVYRDVHTFWPRLDLNALDVSFPAFAAAVVLVVMARRRMALPLAVAYLYQLGVKVTVSEVEAAPTAELLTQIRFASVVSIKQAMTAGTPLDVASRNALVNTMGVADKEINNGAHGVILANANADPKVKGWTRATTWHCCDWCRGLANGQVLPASTPMAAHPHDGCVPQPAFAK